MKRIFAISIVYLSVFVGCNSGISWEKTKSGLEYHFFHKNVAGKQGNVDDMYSLNTTLFNEKNEQVLNEFVIFERYKSLYPGDIHEGLSLLNEGDSVVFKINADSFFYHHGIEKPKTITKPNEILCIHIGVKKIQTPFEYLLEMNEAELTKMNEFVERKNWTMQIDSTGIMYELIEKNPTGKKVKMGDTVQISHLYYNLDEQVFAQTKIGDSWKFVVGSENVRITGLTRMLTFMREGEKIRAILPFTEAFGADGFSGPGVQIPRFTTLVMEVTIHKIIN